MTWVIITDDVIKLAVYIMQSVQDFRRRYNLETWLDRAGASDDAKALVRRMCYDTSKIILRHFEIPDMEPLSFTEDNVIILSKKNV